MVLLVEVVAWAEVFPVRAHHTLVLPFAGEREFGGPLSALGVEAVEVSN